MDDTNRLFSKDTQVVHRHTERCPIALIIEEIQITAAVRYHPTPVRMAKIRNPRNNRCWRRCGEKGALVHGRWECRPVQPPWKTGWRFFKKVKMVILGDQFRYWVFTQRIRKQLIGKDQPLPVFTAALFTIAEL